MIHRVTLNRLSCDKTRSKLNPDQETSLILTKKLIQLHYLQRKTLKHFLGLVEPKGITPNTISLQTLIEFTANS